MKKLECANDDDVGNKAGVKLKREKRKKNAEKFIVQNIFMSNCDMFKSTFCHIFERTLNMLSI